MTNQLARSDPYCGFSGVSPLNRQRVGRPVTARPHADEGINARLATDMAPDPRHQDSNQVVFLAGDDEGAKAPFTRLLTKLRLRRSTWARCAKAGRSCSAAGR
ncbi:hypothetical protein ACFRPV_35945 [Kitasatospora sp. NPDC056808]